MATDLTTVTRELTPELLRQVDRLSPESREDLRLYLDELDGPQPPPGPDWAEVRRRIEESVAGRGVFVDPKEFIAEMRAYLDSKGL